MGCSGVRKLKREWAKGNLKNSNSYLLLSRQDHVPKNAPGTSVRSFLIISLHPLGPYSPPLTEGETETWREPVTFLRSHSKWQSWDKKSAWDGWEFLRISSLAPGCGCISTISILLESCKRTIGVCKACSGISKPEIIHAFTNEIVSRWKKLLILFGLGFY